MLKIEERKDLYKDPHSKGIINTDINAYQLAIARSKERQKQKERLEDVDNQIQSLREDMDLIKSMLQKIVEKM